MAGHGAADCSSRSFRLSASPNSASSSARSRISPAASVAPSSAGTSRTTTAPGPKASITRPSSASSPRRATMRSRRRLVQLDDLGDQQHLAREPRLRQRRLHALIDQPLMRRVLIDDDDAVGGLRDDVGLVQLRPRRAERIVGIAAPSAAGGADGACSPGMSVARAVDRRADRAAHRARRLLAEAARQRPRCGRQLRRRAAVRPGGSRRAPPAPRWWRRGGRPRPAHA